MGVLTDSALTARKLAQADRLVVASPLYFARTWLFRRGTSQVSVRLQARLTLSAAEGVREAVLSGQGFAVASRWMFAPELASGDVVPVLEDWSLPPMDLWVIYPSGRLTSTKARAFVKWFETIIGEAAAKV